MTERNYSSYIQQALDIAAQPDGHSEYDEELALRDGVNEFLRATHEQPESEAQHDSHESPSPWKKIRRTTIALAAVAVSSIALHQPASKAWDSINGPEFSNDTHSFTAGPGDNVTTAAYTVTREEGVRLNSVIADIMDRNEGALSDGLQVGETIQVPNSANK